MTSHDIRQGFPLSPLLFLLVMEGLSLLINDTHKKGRIKGIKISTSIALTNFLFVDDVVLFGLGTLEEWLVYKENLDLFCLASGMSIIVDKSSFLFNDVDEGIRNDILTILPYKMDPIDEGFKYLGYRLKPLGYGIND